MEILSYALWFIASVALLVWLVGRIITESENRHRESELAYVMEGK